MTSGASDAIARLLSKVSKQDDGCWMWTGGKGSRGYGVMRSAEGRSVSVHRYAYLLLVGEIPDGMQLDHTCHTRDLECPGGFGCPHRACVNPAHLEPVTPGTNVRRGRPANAINCRRGHEYTDENTHINAKGHRICRACVRMTANARYANNPTVREEAKNRVKAWKKAKRDQAA